MRVTGATQRRHVLLSAFVAAWHLPTDLGSRHLQWSLDLAAQGVPLRLCSDGSLYSSRPRGELVRPLQPEPFVYDPARTSPREARARAKQMAKAVETSILEQLRAVEERFEAGGWDRLPHKRDWPLVALRIFRRAVLEEPWEEIARADKVAVETVRETVERRAKEFRIPLPEFSPGPRPKI